MNKNVEYAIKKVTVFPDRAQLVVQGKVPVNQNVTTLIFDELPLSIEPESLRVRGHGTAKVRILGVDISSHHYEQTPSDQVRDLENQLEKLAEEMGIQEDQYKVWDAQLEHLQGLRLATSEYAKGLSRGRSSIEEQSKLIQFFRRQDEEIRAAQREIQLKRRELEQKMSKLKRDLDVLCSAQPRHRFQAQVAIEVLTEGDFWPELIYIVRKAGWRPLYDLRLFEQESSKVLELRSIAQISQQTGQAWKSVQISVSTARPALNQRLPELKAWYIDEPRPQQPRSVKTRGTGIQPSMAVMSSPIPDSVQEDLRDEEIFQADVVVAGIHDGGAALKFDIPGTWDIPSDGFPHKMVLSNDLLEPQIDYIAIPKHTDAVYRRATVKNGSGGPLLNGEASIFIADEYIGKTQIVYTPAEGELELLLGVEEQITIKRELTKRMVDKRMLRENRVLRFAYKIELKNHLQTGVNVEVRDHFPVSRHEQIKVKLDRVNPEPGEKSELNLLEWHIAITPGANGSIDYEYIIEHPSTLTVVGLKD